jgi:hypothetical protein
VESAHPPVQWVPVFCHGVNRLGRKFKHASPSSDEVKKEWSSISTPSVRLHGVDGVHCTFL